LGEREQAFFAGAGHVPRKGQSPAGPGPERNNATTAGLSLKGLPFRRRQEARSCANANASCCRRLDPMDTCDSSSSSSSSRRLVQPRWLTAERAARLASHSHNKQFARGRAARRHAVHAEDLIYPALAGPRAVVQTAPSAGWQLASVVVGFGCRHRRCSGGSASQSVRARIHGQGSIVTLFRINWFRLIVW
jgi:hypothetical protein